MGERRSRPVATWFRRRRYRLPGHSPTGISPIGRDDQHRLEAATWAHHLQRQHERTLILSQPFWARLAARTTSAFGSCDYRILLAAVATVPGSSLAWPPLGRSRNCWGKGAISLWAHPLPRRSNYSVLILIFSDSHDDHLVAKMTLS
jgi:hypothetical protein